MLTVPVLYWAFYTAEVCGQTSSFSLPRRSQWQSHSAEMGMDTPALHTN